VVAVNPGAAIRLFLDAGAKGGWAGLKALRFVARMVTDIRIVIPAKAGIQVAVVMRIPVASERNRKLGFPLSRE